MKIAIVTGGSRGIGRNTVISLAERGVDTILTYNARRDAAEEVVAAAHEAGARAIALQIDTGDLRAFDGFVENVRNALAQLGAERFDYLVNNAGNNRHNMPFEKATEEELDSIYNVHFKGVFFLAEAASAHQRRRTNRQPIDGADSRRFARRGSLRVDEGGR